MPTSVVRVLVDGQVYSYPNLDIIGPFVVGTILACVLTGAQIVATWFYFTFRKHDGWQNKLIVWTLLVSCTGDTIAGAFRIVQTCVIDGLDTAAMLNLRAHPEEIVRLSTTNFSCLVAQLFLAFKGLSFIWAMRTTYGRTMRWTLVLIAACLLLSLLVMSSFVVIIPIVYARFETYVDFIDVRLQYYGLWEKLFNAQLSLGTGVDILLTLILSLAFRHARTGFESSNVFMDSVVTITIRNGLLLTVSQVVQVILAHSGQVGWSVMIYIFISKLYGITIIVFLCGPTLMQAAWQSRHDLEAAQAVGLACSPYDRSEKGSNGIAHSAHPSQHGTTSGVGGTSIATSTPCRTCLSGPIDYHPCNSPKLSIAFSTPPLSGSPRIRNDSGIVGLRAALFDLPEYKDDGHDSAPREDDGEKLETAETKSETSTARTPRRTQLLMLDTSDIK